MSHLAVSKHRGEEERGFGGEAPRKFFTSTPFTLAINVTDALFSTTVVLDNEKFGEFACLINGINSVISL